MQKKPRLKREICPTPSLVQVTDEKIQGQEKCGTAARRGAATGELTGDRRPPFCGSRHAHSSQHGAAVTLHEHVGVMPT